MSTPARITAPVHYVPDCSQRQIEDVLATLDKWSARNGAHVCHRRMAERQVYRGFIVVIQMHQTVGTDPDAPPIRCACRVMGRNISRSGVGLIVPPAFAPKMMSDVTPILKTDDVFRRGGELTLSLPVTGLAPLIVHGTVVRVRPIFQDFFEIGVQFTKKEEIGSDDWARVQQLLAQGS